MGQLKLTGITKSYNKTQVIKPIDLTIDEGEFAVFVGPSGCGKSTMLRMIAGLEEITSGTVEIDGQVVNDLPPVKRGISMVFQSYALYPHMSVFENIAFPLRVARMEESEVKALVHKAADVLKLTERLEHRPGELSGGQRQRVAIGRAIVREPQIFLFDEPLSNLDAALRADMRVELSRLHSKLGNTMIYVTHDQIEAMTMADKIVVLRDGIIEQVGSPLELFHKPANKFVAGFIGNPNMNFMPCLCTKVEALSVTVSLHTGITAKIPVPGTDVAVGDTLTLGIRPSDMTVGAGEVSIPFTPEVVERLGNETVIYGATGGDTPLCVVADGNVRVQTGEVQTFGFSSVDAHLFRANGVAFARKVDLAALAELD
ncbi:ABC transporter ATP-binding protein [Celeribacter halophilus]|uniref:ABC transporter ATP-binding protein n=1 Tax=Celeribacter halophilus TaxID=576117 RepID=UPI001C097015|nr:sn-glycerol-3-phosphate ABC transporter ATP-binding protein UgpC [Celeribacter halophilus]MBU2888085.1 sn-glycerol-3-phosphate ABC transporter ATP-binding protein UgpC [Celeribacter halophilus]MDO6511856.1 sn-glycerol-3-phosphate ABC transporter ATP-binding protein UgpC [Celeribacter halophilus]